MKLLLLLLLALTGISQTTRADTIDYWHVYYNKIKIKECNDYNIRDIIIKTDKVKSGDVITVYYFRDTPGSEAITNLSIEDGKHHVVFASKGKGTGNPISFSLKDLLAYKQKSGGNDFEIFYFYNAIGNIADPKLLFRIKFK
ncbi:MULTISPECIES: hypothetical protein [Niastella]|uniref:Uncharacterized protein n=1 Tax=Niastella soli TaxID=2821487 RepID=A0ABS3YYE4_9BACT|nr:hypothetical protein [Niastella soli]MBO9202435.1 hypothetical protein [Niastella soli]